MACGVEVAPGESGEVGRVSVDPERGVAQFMPPLSGAKNGLMYSHTISPRRVTSNSLPCAPSQISVFPLGSRSAPLMYEL